MEQANDNGSQPVVEVQASEAGDANPTDAAPQTTKTNWMDIVFKRHMVYDPLMLVFSLFIMIMGVVGYVTKGSVASIVSSTLFFLVLLLVTYWEGVQRNAIPLILCLAVLFIFMGVRYVKKGEFYPSGLVAALSLLMLFRHLYMLLARRNLS